MGGTLSPAVPDSKSPKQRQLKVSTQRAAANRKGRNEGQTSAKSDVGRRRSRTNNSLDSWHATTKRPDNAGNALGLSDVLRDASESHRGSREVVRDTRCGPRDAMPTLPSRNGRTSPCGHVENSARRPSSQRPDEGPSGHSKSQEKQTELPLGGELRQSHRTDKPHRQGSLLKDQRKRGGPETADLPTRGGGPHASHRLPLSFPDQEETTEKVLHYTEEEGAVCPIA